MYVETVFPSFNTHFLTFLQYSIIPYRSLPYALSQVDHQSLALLQELLSGMRVSKDVQIAQAEQ